MKIYEENKHFIWLVFSENFKFQEGKSMQLVSFIDSYQKLRQLFRALYIPNENAKRSEI